LHEVLAISDDANEASEKGEEAFMNAPTSKPLNATCYAVVNQNS
jgi:hypothetical protein